ncbi:UNVERIFIED_CONTAM: hypothetical protein Scaly_2246000 [Sesamum calycinum]|uniref:Uncharacterized protein n=1 Tax=Sesamum calycinum TaxID=2727403 RepID=A0AAW2MBA5_9LAMI
MLRELRRWLYNKNLSGRAGLTPEFEDGIKTFIEWARVNVDIWMEKKLGVFAESAKTQSLEHLTKSVIICVCECLCQNIIIGFRIDDIVRNYFEALSVPLVSEEPTPAGHVEGVPDDGMRYCPMDADPFILLRWWPYDYDESGLADHLFNVVHAADLPLWDGCTESQLGVVERIYDRISQWANRILPPDHTLPRDYYITKKLVKDLGLPVEKIHACKNGCMLYWKDDVDLEYCNFFGDARYKPSRGRNPHGKTSPYAVLRYLTLTLSL